MRLTQIWNELKAVALLSPGAFWCFWIGAHIVLCVLGLYGPGGGFNDVTMPYKMWSEQVFHGAIPGISYSFVYPFVALAAMLPPWLFGGDGYGFGWSVMVFILDSIAIGLITRWGTKRGRMKFAWWWLGFLVCLGPVALGRIDAVACALALMAIALVVPRPKVAGALLAIGTWIKIWPVAIGISFVVALRSRVRILFSAIITALSVVVIGIGMGGAANVFSFVTEQGSRGLQIEAVAATPLLWLRLFGVSGVNVTYDESLMTNQFEAPGSVPVATLIGMLMPVVVLAVSLLAIWAMRRGAPGRSIVSPLALALVLALILFNKVGSPQFMAWLAAPVLVYFLFGGSAGRIPALFGLLVGAITQLYYPYLYVEFINNGWFFIAMFTIRNIILIGLFVWSLQQILKQGKSQGARASKYSMVPALSRKRHARTSSQ